MVINLILLKYADLTSLASLTSLGTRELNWPKTRDFWRDFWVLPGTFSACFNVLFCSKTSLSDEQSPDRGLRFTVPVLVEGESQSREFERLFLSFLLEGAPLPELTLFIALEDMPKPQHAYIVYRKLYTFILIESSKKTSINRTHLVAVKELNVHLCFL